MSKHPYSDGYNAAVRIEDYEGYTTVPPNPYEKGTEQYQEWEDGFDDGTDWLCVWQYMEDC